MARIAQREAMRRVSASTGLGPGSDLEEPDVRALDAMDSALTGVDVRRVLLTLSLEDRQILEMRYRSDMTQSAVAARLGLPEGTVKVRLHRLRKLLQDRF